MAKLFLIQTEKAYNMQSNNTYVLGCNDLNAKLNKIELGKMLVKNNLNPIQITVVNLPAKKKRRGRKATSTVEIKRTKKFYVTLAEGQKIDEETVFEF